MVLRNIVRINEDRCTGCGLCASDCAEGAIKVIDGKARLVSESYCDGLGACIGHCPENAITIESRDAAEFDKEATEAHLAQQMESAVFVCPGVAARNLARKGSSACSVAPTTESQLSHWPVQLRLVSPSAPYFANADLLLAADCVPFAMGDFHERLLKGRSVVVGCPKLDDPELYTDKLAAILKANDLSSLTVVHMEVPCCAGLVRIARQAIARCGVHIPFKDITIGLEGTIVKTERIEPGP